MTIIDIQKMVADFYGIKVEAMVGKTKIPDIVFPRQVSIYLCFLYKKFTQCEILTKHGLTTQGGVRYIENKLVGHMDIYPNIRKDIEGLKSQLGINDRMDYKREVLRKIRNIKENSILLRNEYIRSQLTNIYEIIEKNL